MSLFERKPRPLKRGEETLRDDRLFIIACDDTYAPKQYFDSFSIPRIQIHVVPTTDGTSAAPHVLDRLSKFDHEDDDELWMLLDTDHCTRDNHIGTFLGAIGAARQKGVNVALSKPSFELWLLLHHVDGSAVTGLRNATATEQLLRDTLGLYNKTRLDMAKFPLSTVATACARAERLDQSVGGGDNPTGPTTRVYQLWKAIASKALPSQLPEELRSLL
ncbi:RloB family protein [Burkholderia vietnamiensis]|uniref:RloB family protein n=1 Tax=Burkholderia vietnamiensis TaxID=60552 RepID=UPI002DD43882|nr:RloB family protein [Burkholderia vietnamiensis]MEC4598955.1 RloB family protein [Burkholderia vietnamiensis]HDR9189918.1 RloB domain-containing protein [Burkholderia vietnamiensis]